MSYLTLNGAMLVRAVIRLPLVGAWVADVEHLDAPAVSAGDSATLVLGSQTWVGTVVRAEAAQGRTWDARIVGGAGGLGGTLAPRQYMTPPASLVVGDLLSEVGETLDAPTRLRLAGSLLRAWVRRAATAGQELDELARVLGYRWRVLPSGDVWLGEDDGDAVALEDFELLEEDAARGLTLVACSEPTITPGQTWTNPQTGASYEVGAVVIRVSEADTRAEIWASRASTGRLGEMLSRLIQKQASPDLYAAQEYTVVSQNVDGTLELRSGAEGYPDLSRVGYRPGIPGASFEGAAGARCLVAFRGGDPQDPYVASWVSGTPTSLSLPVTSLLHLGALSAADFVALDSPVQTNYTAIAASISNIAAAVNTLAPGSVTVIYGSTSPITPTAATKTKAT